ncbi:MAG: 50S ribosomal protein L1, partial [Sulfolobales archaeon]|nr:50S ribosomal protein L1 [Sulfolobales archaeon]
MTLVPDNALAEAIKTALSTDHNPERNFAQSVEMIVTFKGIDMKKGELKLREIVVLPKAPPKEMKVLVVPTLQQMDYARKAEPNVV